jgi:hypothetical protein
LLDLRQECADAHNLDQRAPGRTADLLLGCVEKRAKRRTAGLAHRHPVTGAPGLYDDLPAFRRLLLRGMRHRAVFFPWHEFIELPDVAQR